MKDSLFKNSVLALLVLLCLEVLGIFMYTYRTNTSREVAKIETKPTHITIGTFSKAFGNTPYYIAKHFKWFEGNPALQGVSITYKEYNDRPTIASAFGRGELQLLFSAEVPSILIRAQGEDTQIATVHATAVQEIVVPTDSPIKSVLDLRGKKVAVLAGTSSHYGMLKILNTAGLGEKDINVFYMSPAEAKVAFETGEIDAWAVWAPWVEQQEVTGFGRTLTGGNAVIHSVMTMPRSFIEEHPSIARALVETIERSKEWVVTNEKEAQKISAEQIGLDLNVVEKAWGKFNWKTRLNASVIQDVQEKADFLASQDKTRTGASIDVVKEFIWFYEKSGS